MAGNYGKGNSSFNYHVSCQSDHWNGEEPSEDMIGFCILAKYDCAGNKMASWNENGVRCRPGYIVFIKSSKLNKAGATYHGSAYKYIFGTLADNNTTKLCGFSYYQGVWKTTSRTYNNSEFGAQYCDPEYMEKFKSALKQWNQSRRQNYTWDEL